MTTTGFLITVLLLGFYGLIIRHINKQAKAREGRDSLGRYTRRIVWMSDIRELI